MDNRYQSKSLLRKLPLNRAVGKDGTFAEHIFMLIQACVINSVASLMCV